MIVASFSTLQVIQGMDDDSKPSGQLNMPLGIQLRARPDTLALETVLEGGGDVLLKLSMDLDTFKRPIEEENLEKGKLEIPIKLFFVEAHPPHSRTADSPIEIKVKVDCESDSPTYVLPPKPSSFDSYAQFTDWLKGGYFSNQVRIIYDFNVDVKASAPALAERLFAVNSVYQLIGTYVVDNPKIEPDECIPEIFYNSERDNTNVTTVSLGGTLILNKKRYPIDTHKQMFDHPIVRKTILKRDITKRFYSQKWLAKLEATVKINYDEFPRDQIQNWPNAPVSSYSLLRKVYDDLEEIKHLGCWNSTSGESVHLSDDRVFLIDYEEAIDESIESIMKDETGNFYIARYLCSVADFKEREDERMEKLEQEKNQKELLNNLPERLGNIEGIQGVHSSRLSKVEETIGTPTVPVLAVAVGGTGEQGALAPRSLTQRLEEAETTLATHSTDLQNHTTKLGQVETEIGTDVPWGPAGSIKQRLKQAESNLTNLNNRYTGHCHPLVGGTVGYTNGPHQ